MQTIRIITFKIILMLHLIYIFHSLFICFPVLSIFFEFYFYFWYLPHFFFIQQLDNLYRMVYFWKIYFVYIWLWIQI